MPKCVSDDCWFTHYLRVAVSIGLALSAPAAASGRPRDREVPIPEGITLKDGTTFEYVVVGAGAAGCPVAARLALAGASVLLVEAGGDPPLVSMVPGGIISLIGSSYDWAYKTLPNNASCLASAGGGCRFSRGKCLGGSTSINHMLYTRGNRRDYDLDLPGWSWKDLKPYFLRYEGLNELNRLPRSSFSNHNSSGVMKMTWFDESPWHSTIFDGYKHLNFPFNKDVNGESQIGTGFVPGYVHKGSRMSTARAYLAREDVQTNLKIAKNSHCTGVIVDENNVAKGVTVIQHPSNKTVRIFARKEVILSAGTVGTPQILMLSGIGPAKHLHEMGIPARADLPVGENMHEHVTVVIFLQVAGPGFASTVTQMASNIVDWLWRRSGPLASIGLVDIGTFANTHCYNSTNKMLDNGFGCELPNLQMIHLLIDRYMLTLGEELFRRGGGFVKELTKQFAAASAERALLMATPILLTPRSRGWIKLASLDPLEQPAIFPNFLSDERDVDDIVRSILLIEDLVATPAFRDREARIVRVKLPGCPRYVWARRARYWRCYARHVTGAGLHAVGSTPLGAVLDARLRVRGVARLRVADAGALPTAPRGSTEAAAIALGERLADFLLEDYNNTPQS